MEECYRFFRNCIKSRLQTAADNRLHLPLSGDLNQLVQNLHLSPPPIPSSQPPPLPSPRTQSLFSEEKIGVWTKRRLLALLIFDSGCVRPPALRSRRRRRGGFSLTCPEAHAPQCPFSFSGSLFHPRWTLGVGAWPVVMAEITACSSLVSPPGGQRETESTQTSGSMRAVDGWTFKSSFVEVSRCQQSKMFFSPGRTLFQRPTCQRPTGAAAGPPGREPSAPTRPVQDSCSISAAGCWPCCRWHFD